MTDDCHNSDNVKTTPDHRSVMAALSLEVIGEGEDNVMFVEQFAKLVLGQPLQLRPADRLSDLGPGVVFEQVSGRLGCTEYLDAWLEQSEVFRSNEDAFTSGRFVRSGDAGNEETDD